MATSLPVVTGQEAVQAFRKAGFVVSRIRGSHHVMKKSGHPLSVTVPVHGHDSVAKGTLRSLISNAGLTVEEFTSLLD